MSNIIQEDLGEFNVDEIDDFFLAPDMQDCSYNHTLASGYGNNYNSVYNFVLKNDENQPSNVHDFYEPSSVGSDASSTAGFLSSDATSTAVLPSSDVSSAVSVPIKQLLHGRIKEKMRAEGRQETSLVSLPRDSLDNQLTPEEERKKFEKQQRNKEAARKSRQKKKEEEDKLFKDNKILTAINGELKLEVAKFKNINEKCEQFFSNHRCDIFPPQQDNGDKMCVETGGNKVWDDNDLVTNLVDMNIYEGQTSLPFIQGSKSQRVSAIVCQLQGDLPSEVVTSASTVNDAKIFCNANAGYNIGIQENVLPDSLHNVANNYNLKTGTGAFGVTSLAGREEEGSETEMNTENIGANQFIPQGMSLETDVVTQIKRSTSKLSAWSTEEDNQSEAEEALNLVRGVHPPPEKKIRRE